MAYTVNKTDGTVLATVADGTINNTTTNLTLIGKNYSGYGELLNENLVKLLENFASSSAPSSPMRGQLWWDLSNNLLKVYTGTGFKIISGSTASASQPTSATAGDMWFDTANAQLRVYNGTSWTLIGPSYTAGTGTSGTIVTTVLDNTAQAHVLVQFYVNESIVAVASKDAFTPQGLVGFTTVAPGIQLSTSVSGAKFTGTATKADAIIDGVTTLEAANIMRRNANNTVTGELVMTNNNGITLGSSAQLTINVVGNDVNVSNQIANGDINIKVNKSVGGVVTAMNIDGATGYITVQTPTANDNSTKIATTAYVDTATGAAGYLKANGSNAITGTILPSIDDTYNLGSNTKKFAAVYSVLLNGQALTALYADLAERFEADTAYEPGTVVELGGTAEITAVGEELSDKVFGVISTKPGFTMNEGAGTSDTHPPVAMTGRVPVKVIGKVNKGDRLVSAGNGLARAAKPGEATSFNVIGRAIESKTSTGQGTVNAVVKIQ